MSRALVQALRPTTRAVAWTPLLAGGGLLLALATLLRVWGTTSTTVVALGSGAMAAALVFSLRDPAADLLAAVPVSRAVRRLLRLGLVTAVVVPLWLVITLLLPGHGTALAPLAALAAVGVGLATWLPAAWDSAIAAGLPLLWVTVSEIFGGVHGVVGDAATAWSTHPWIVISVGVASFVLGRHR